MPVILITIIFVKIVITKIINLKTEVKMKTAQMLKTKLPKGFIFRNIAKLGRKPNWQMVRVKQK